MAEQKPTWYDELFSTPEKAAMTISEMQTWFEHHAEHDEASRDDLLNCCVTELYDAGGYLIDGCRKTYAWLLEDAH